MKSPTSKVRGSPLIGRLRNGVWITLAVKFAVLIALYLLFFSPSQRPHLDGRAIAHHFLTAG